MDQETTGMLQTQTKIRTSNSFRTSVEGIGLYEWDSGVGFEKAPYQQHYPV